MIKIHSNVGEHVVLEIVCPKCKERILLVPDLRAMTKAIDNHVNFHVRQIKKRNISKHQVLLEAEELEDALAKEVLKELCHGLPLDFIRQSESSDKPKYEL